MTLGYCDYCGTKINREDCGRDWKIPIKKDGRADYIEFCGDQCVEDYISKTMEDFFAKLLEQEKRIKALEEKEK